MQYRQNLCRTNRRCTHCHHHLDFLAAWLIYIIEVFNVSVDPSMFMGLCFRRSQLFASRRRLLVHRFRRLLRRNANVMTFNAIILFVVGIVWRRKDVLSCRIGIIDGVSGPTCDGKAALLSWPCCVCWRRGLRVVVRICRVGEPRSCVYECRCNFRRVPVGRGCLCCRGYRNIERWMGLAVQSSDIDRFNADSDAIVFPAVVFIR